jgi:tetratricopeptide (TPR) repeat protein
MNQPDPILARISEGIGLRQQGRKGEARALFDQLWSEIEAGAGNPLHRCVLAHSAADAQDDAADELRWDRIALEAAEAVSDDQVAAAGVGLTAAALFPSLHLSVGECHYKLGDLDQARVHLDRARRTMTALPDSEYGAMIRNGFDDLARRLEEAVPPD